LVPTKRLEANFSKPSASISLLRIAFLPSGVKLTASPFNPALQPDFLLGIVDVHELIADAAAIDAAQLVQQLARRGGGETQECRRHRPGVSSTGPSN
jgi:hypothetical protein